MGRSVIGWRRRLRRRHGQEAIQACRQLGEQGGNAWRLIAPHPGANTDAIGAAPTTASTAFSAPSIDA